MSEQLSMFGTTFHGPALVKGTEDEWIVMCPACSDSAREIVNRCDFLKEFPPRVMVDAAYKATLTRIRGRKKVTDNNAPMTSEPTDTQRKAHKVAEPRAGTRRKAALELISRFPFGLTDSELEKATGWTHQSASATRNSLMRDGFIMDSGHRRKNQRGNDEIVWFPVP